MVGARLVRGGLAGAFGLLLLLATSGLAASFRISNLVVTNSNRALLVNAVLLGSLPASVVEGLATGIPASVRFQVELWQYNNWWVDRRVATKIVERHVAYDLLTKEYRMSAVEGEVREPYVARDIWEVERVLSELRRIPLAPITLLKRDDLYYVRVRAEVRSGTPDSSVSKVMPFLSSKAETEWEQSPLLTVSRTR